ncbi:MAG: hypothetical protein KJT03_16885, partial [Verrucomicrobiae bacterium]|nr:hypothetical protein [Verrucomicrobiae bacterium]
CTVCHQNDQTATMVAPPMFAVVDHYTKNYGEDKSGFVEAIMDWAKSPDESKSLMPGAIQKFKLMPPFPIPDKDLKAIATYLSEADFTIPGWYDEHYLQEHGEARTGN